MRHKIVLPVILLAGLLGVSCGKKGVPDDGEVPYSYIEVVSGNPQVGTAGSFLEDSLLVRVMNSVGFPIVGDTVTFTQISPRDGGQITYVQRLTNASGFARTFYRVDTLVGVDTIMASASSVDDTGAALFEIRVLPEVPDSVVKVSPLGAIISSVAGEPIAQPFVVRVIDRYGNPVPGDTVYFKADNRCVVVTDYSDVFPYELDSAFTVTDTIGLAMATWVLTINPDPVLGYPNRLPSLRVYNGTRDTVTFYAAAGNPGMLEYYYDIRPIFADNCYACHPGLSDYRLNFYYELENHANLIPGDTNSVLLDYANAFRHFGNINIVEEDKVIRWVVTDSAAPGSSGLNNYTVHMQGIFNAACISCHGETVQEGNYKLTTHAEIRGGGSDAVANAIPGDSLSFLVVQMKQRHQWDKLDPDSVAAAVLADSLIRWVVDDSLRQY